jgi:cytidylate kinase
MITTDATGRFLEAQLKEWDREDEEQKGARPGPVIAITRVPGCGGESIARTLAKEFGLVLYDWEIVEAIAKDAHVSEQVVATMDEKYSSELDEWLAGFTGGPSLSSYKYMQCLRRVLFTVATHGNAVILGRGANFLLPPEKKTLGLCLAAPLEARVKNVMQELRLSQENAQKHIARIEQEQRTWIKKHGCADINDVTHYHLVINTALVTTETIVQIVKGFIGPEL